MLVIAAMMMTMVKHLEDQMNSGQAEAEAETEVEAEAEPKQLQILHYVSQAYDIVNNNSNPFR